jgi:hypothetical protein
MRSRDPANRPPRADDRFAHKQQRVATGPGVALRSSGIAGSRDRLVAICCAQHMATYGALRTMLPMVQSGKDIWLLAC